MSLRLAILLVAVCCSVLAQQTAPQLARGEITEKVIALADPGQSYALYLPSSYDPARKWPVIFAFDPVARGQLPVRLLREAAERYGYIVLGSYNSRNGPVRPQIEAFQAMWNDAHRRFALDDRRAYTTGFSGGSRNASLSANLCKCIAGVIGVGAGLSENVSPTKELPFVFYGITGEEDFNYPELVRLRERLDELDIENELRVIVGPHRWAPAEEMTAAVAWMELHAMRSGRRPPDPAFIAKQWESALESARSAGQRGDAYSEYLAYRSAARAFRGLRDTSAADQKAAALQDSAAVRSARKQEEQDVEWQERLTARVQDLVQAVTRPSEERPAQFLALRSELSTLRPREKQPVVRTRAAAHVMALIYETGEQAARDSDFQLAAELFDICVELAPKSPGPLFQLAKAQARAGKKKDALRALERAAALGMRGRALLAAEPDLASLRDDPRFQQLLANVPE
jgi:tetratricopeptide (TPR) repeat protein